MTERTRYEIIQAEHASEHTTHEQLYRLDEYGRPVAVPYEDVRDSETHLHPGHDLSEHAGNHQSDEPRFYRSVRQELLLRFLTALGRLLAWPLKLVGILIEQLVKALGSVFKMILIIILVPTILYYAYKHYTAADESGPQAIGSAAGSAITQTTKGVISGIGGAIRHDQPDSPEAANAPNAAPPAPPTVLDPAKIVTTIGPRIIGDIIHTIMPGTGPAQGPNQAEPNAQPQQTTEEDNRTEKPQGLSYRHANRQTD